MQTIYQNNILTNVSNLFLGDTYLKDWTLRNIRKGCRYNYEEISSLPFVKENEKPTESVELSGARIEELIKNYLYEYVGDSKRERTAEIVIGLPCSGKTTHLNEKDYTICDSDLIKRLMPEYDDGIGNERCHKASTIVFDKLIEELAYYGYNLGIPIIGKRIENFNKVYNILIQNNYLIKVTYIKISKIESLNRALKRYLEENRFVSLKYINEINEKDIDDVYETVVNYPCVVEHNIILEENTDTMNMYAVDVKCGHVGINNYVVKTLVIPAVNGKEAAEIARYTPRVKHDHTDAIINVRKIDVIESARLNKINDEDKYFKCKCRREQRSIDLNLLYEDREKKKYEKTGKYKKIKKHKLIEKDMLREINYYKTDLRLLYE